MSIDDITADERRVAALQFGWDASLGADLGEFRGLAHGDRKTMLTQIGGIPVAAFAAGVFEQCNRRLGSSSCSAWTQKQRPGGRRERGQTDATQQCSARDDRHPFTHCWCDPS